MDQATDPFRHREHQEVPQNYAVGFSVELWARVIQLMQTDLVQGLGDPPSDFNSDLKQQSHYYNLPLVCRKLRDVFSSYPELCQILLIPKSIETSKLPALLGWIRKRGSHIKVLADNSSKLQVSLASLAGSPKKLSRIYCSGLSKGAVEILSSFSNLQCCDFGKVNSRRPISLLPLQSLHSVQDLRLRSGHFTHLHAAAHLTSLCSESAQVEADRGCPFAATLQKLQLSKRGLSGLHEKGISACEALTELHLHSSRVNSKEGSLYMPHRIPDSITQLKELRHLAISLTQQDAPMAWLYELRSLQNLRIMYGTNSMHIKEELTQLQSLTVLTFHNASGHMLERCQLHLQVDWSAMSRLRSLSVHCAKLVIDCKVQSVKDLSSLKVLQVSCCDLTGQYCATEFGNLVYSLALTRPDISLILKGGDRPLDAHVLEGFFNSIQ